MVDTKKVIYEDKYLDAVVGNVLDQYVNTSYNLKLFMIPAKTGDGGGWLEGAYAALPKDTIVIAQTGVTGVQIDNLNLQIVKDSKNGNSMAVRASFQLFQPGAADLLDQIQAAKHALGHYMFSDVPLFLAIEFMGYEADTDETDEGEDDYGAVTKPIAGPYIFRLQIAKVGVQIDNKGSLYDFECPVGADSAFTDEYFKLPKDLKVQGNKIEELAQDLQDQLNKYREDNLDGEEYHDKILFDLSQVKAVLKDTEVTRAGANRADEVNRLINAQERGIKTRKEYEQALEDNPDSFEGGVDAGTNWKFDQNINMKEGTDLNQFFTTLLVMCPDFLDEVSRKNVFDDDAENGGIDLEKAFNMWYKIEAEINYDGAKFDRRRGKYSKTIVYKPIIYKTADPKMHVSADEEELTKDQVTKRIKEMNIKKAYHYLYTGLNDQVLGADISYNAGQLLLRAPGGGYMGSLDTNANKVKTNEGEDLNALQRLAKVKAKNKATAALTNRLKDDPSFANRVQGELGLTNDQMSDVMADKAKREALAQALIFTNNQGQDPLGYYNSAAAGTDASTPTAPPINPSVAPYKPEASGFSYSADLLEDYGGSETVIGELNAFRNQRNARRTLRAAALGDNEDELDTSPRPKAEYGKSVVTTGSETSDGGSSATLFGYMYNNVNDKSILIDLGLKVRGDPWYLGKPMSYADAIAKRNNTLPNEDDVLSGPAATDEEESTNEYAVYSSSDNYFLFTMQTPRVRDPDVDDEDANSGYMERAGTSFFISGVYQVIAVTASFSGGLFEIEFDRAPKVTALSLAKFDLTKS